ncbi:hypothetical protein BVX97_02850 [bacterium E08(2017)]|nr:hypothetical protein BVX97_02850 [bacterium E08(2017)]
MNSLMPDNITPEECPVIEGSQRVRESFAAYLEDESRLSGGEVSAIYFPENTAQVVDAVRKAGGSIIVSGSRTGIAGGAVGLEGASIISLEKMDKQLGKHRLQAGVKLEDIKTDAGAYYPVDPTEMTASIGGTVSTDASGARTYYYGSTRNFIKGITVVLADSSVLKISRGEVTSEGGQFIIGDTVVPVADINMPDTKNTAGLFLKKEMDLIDLFIGSEGLLGIVTEVEITTAPIPENRLFLVVYAGDEAQALDFVKAVKSKDDLDSLAIEYFDTNAVSLVRTVENAPHIPDDAACAIYLELLMESEDAEEALAEVLDACGLDMDSTWAGFEEKELAEMKRFRHLVPETVNAMIGQRRKELPELHKIGTDTAVPEGRLGDLLEYSRSAIESKGIDYVVFGHIGNNHLHINMIPSSMETLEAAKEIYVDVARKSVELGGTVSAEHGIGRLKKHFLEIQFSYEELEAMRTVKKALDPECRLNPGVMI